MDNNVILAAAGIPEMYGQAMLADITAAQWTQQAPALLSHPASIMAHLATVTAFTLGMLTHRPPQLPAGMNEQAVHSTQAQPGAYPGKEELLSTWKTARQGILEWLRQASDEQLAAPITDEYLVNMFPSVGALAAATLTVHESTHFGQLSAWRRSMGLELPI